ncbi:MAG: endo alpha-1,4 polygalactosaminidase [Candidatus Hydrogenedentes bacterium]|nr:endo alpha-1,4 polygalactosaminidase [Candidatus Hydrogenedentota bacterium]
MNWRLLSRALVLALAGVLVLGCLPPDDGDGDPDPEPPATDYRAEMRDFVVELAAYARGIDPGFIVIAQNGPDLLTEDGEPDGTLVDDYADALDGQGQEHPFYGQEGYNIATAEEDRDYYVALLDRAEEEGIEVLATDYCSVPALILDGLGWASTHGYIHFAAPNSSYDLDSIPTWPAEPYGVNTDTIASLGDARNFLYLIDSTPFGTRSAFVMAVQGENYDLLIMDPFHNGTAFTAAQVTALREKANGGKRFVIAYLNIGAAENWRYYWDDDWEVGNPAWIAGQYSGYPDEYWVEYWNDEWKDIIFGGGASFVKKILDAGFDGVYLDNILAYEYFESGAGA